MKDILEDIARTPRYFSELENITATYAVNRPEPVSEPIAHNHWAEVTKDDFGRYYDFEVIDLPDGRSVFYAESKAALKWAWTKAHESTPRWNDKGFIVDKIDHIVKDAEKAGLTDRRWAENENVSNQG